MTIAERLEIARRAHAEAEFRYVNSSWRMGPQRRRELVAAADEVRRLEAWQEAANNG